MENTQNEHKAEILWESKEKNEQGEPFLTVKRSRNYFLYSQRAGTDSIAFILVDNDLNLIGLISESKPPLDERFNEKHMDVTAFGGSIDKDLSYIEICQAEVIEESGFDVPMDRITYEGETIVSSQMNQICHCYSVDITGLKSGDTEADIFNSICSPKDTDEFSHNKVVWKTPDEVMNTGDLKSIFIYTKMKYRKEVFTYL